jgi:hypothetical protein
VSHVEDAHSELAMRVVGVRDGVLGESLRWWSNCITCNSEDKKEQYKLQYDVDKGYREGEHYGVLD